MTPYTHRHLADIEPAATRFPLPGQTVRFATSALGAQQTGVTLQRYEPEAHPGFGHRHRAAEEVYVVIAGSGRIKLDDDVIEVRAFDAIRVAPHVWRAFSAGPEGMDLVAFGPHHEADGESRADWWPRD
jgi:mannose-6-phosphate isomerase-like protein (cupin superfamily)